LLYFAKIGDWKEAGSPATQESIIAAINWLVGQDVDVMNFSYGGLDTPGMDPSEIAFANAVRNDRITVCISAGNEGADGYYTVGSPGAIPDAITVGAIDTTGGSPYDMPYFSSKGVTTDNQMKPDVLAPGVGIVSIGKSGDSYNTLQGTSMSCPHVTGASAVLIQACRANGFAANPAVIKAALLKTAKQLTPLENYPYILQGKGYVNVGAAWTYILNSQKSPGGTPFIGACNPVKQPLVLWNEVAQGQVLEQFLTCVCPVKNASRELVISGDVSSFVTLGGFVNEYSSPNKITYTIPTNATTGTYTGQIEFKFNDILLDTVDIELEVTPSNGHRMLLHHKSTNWHQNNMFGQYKFFVEDIFDNGWVVSEQEVDLTTDVLNSYEAIWFPDPFSYTYPQAYLGDYSVRGTYNAPSSTEITNMHNYLANGGTLFFDFLGHVANDYTLEGYSGTNITLINSFVEQYGISIRPNVWDSDATIPVNTLTSTPLTAGVSSVDHYGASLEILEGYNVTMVTELTPGSEYATCAIAEVEGGGRIIVWGTNFALDTIGYINGYNAGVTQNDVFGMNLVRWATAKHRMQRISINDNGDGTITFKYLYANGPGADFGGYVDTPSGRVSLTGWTDNGEGVYTLTYEFQSKGAHHFYPECGETGVDDFDYYYINATKSGGLGIGTVGIILISIFGLSGWYLIQRKRRN
jgi:hypothetical protein